MVLLEGLHETYNLGNSLQFMGSFTHIALLFYSLII